MPINNLNKRNFEKVKTQRTYGYMDHLGLVLYTFANQ